MLWQMFGFVVKIKKKVVSGFCFAQTFETVSKILLVNQCKLKLADSKIAAIFIKCKFLRIFLFYSAWLVFLLQCRHADYI
jgi:hypothetical protein